jgi:hypothetical protein
VFGPDPDKRFHVQDCRDCCALFIVAGVVQPGGGGGEGGNNRLDIESGDI